MSTTTMTAVPETAAPAPVSARPDARNRALRTFLQGLLLDVAAATVVVLLATFSTIEWTGAYWLAVAGLVGKTVLMATVSYLARRLVPPPSA